jgi:hypothetical protein
MIEVQEEPQKEHLAFIAAQPPERAMKSSAPFGVKNVAFCLSVESTGGRSCGSSRFFDHTSSPVIRPQKIIEFPPCNAESIGRGVFHTLNLAPLQRPEQGEERLLAQILGQIGPAWRQASPEKVEEYRTDLGVSGSGRSVTPATPRNTEIVHAVVPQRVGASPYTGSPPCGRDPADQSPLFSRWEMGCQGPGLGISTVATRVG